MPTGETIAAIASAPARSLRAVVRLSGPHVPALLADIARPAPTTRGAHACIVTIGDVRLPVLVAYFAAPSSYTGEHAAELLLPGNPFLVERIVNAIAALPGVRHAEPGEFTARAYFNGKLTLEQAEAVAQTIAAERDDQLDEAARILTGRAGDDYRARADQIANLLALVEAGIDFTDQEDVVAITPAKLSSELAAVQKAIADRAGAQLGDEARTDAPSIVLVGEPNAGKSTLFNALLGRARTIESATPGSTRDDIAETLALADIAHGAPDVMLHDLPGLDPDHDASAHANARDAIENADLIIHCDPTGRFKAAPSPETQTIRVRTKADLPGPASTLSVCALDGWHIDALRHAIADAAVGGGSTMLPRHRVALDDTRRHLDDALDAFDHNAERLRDPELVASALRAALDAVGRLAGRIEPDQIIGRVFATFCVGK